MPVVPPVFPVPPARPLMTTPRPPTSPPLPSGKAPGCVPVSTVFVPPLLIICPLPVPLALLLDFTAAPDPCCAFESVEAVPAVPLGAGALPRGPFPSAPAGPPEVPLEVPPELLGDELPPEPLTVVLPGVDPFAPVLPLRAALFEPAEGGGSTAALPPTTTGFCALGSLGDMIVPPSLLLEPETPAEGAVTPRLPSVPYRIGRDCGGLSAHPTTQPPTFTAMTAAASVIFAVRPILREGKVAAETAF